MKKASALFLALFIIPILSNCNAQTYTVTWKDWDGKVLEVDENLHNGDIPTYDGKALFREGYKYTFSGWGPEITPINGDNQVYVAQYKAEYNCDAYLKVNISAIDTEITLTYTSSGETSSIDWGDDTINTNTSHIYNSVGEYEIRIHGNVTNVGFGSDNKSCLKTLFLGSTVDKIEDEAYKDCTNLESVEFAEDNNVITSIGASAFEGCSSLTSFKIPESVSAIQQSAFSGCASLKSITLRDNLTQIGNGAFQRSGLTSIDVPEGVVVIAPYAFGYCYDLESVTIHGAVTIIGDGAFINCESLTAVTFNDVSKLIEIGHSAFYVCKVLKEIIIPGNVVRIGAYAFHLCNKLTIYCEADFKPDAWADSWNDSGRPCYWGFLNKGVTSDGFSYFSTKTGSYIIDKYIGSATDVVIPDTIDNQPVISIAKDCFYYNDKITSLTLPSTLKTISSEMCENCKSLTSVNIPSGIETVGSYSFYNCNKLQHVNFDSNSQLTALDRCCFYNCKALQSIVIPESVVTVGQYVLFGCESLTSLTVPKNVETFSRVIEECLNLETIVVDPGNNKFDSRNDCNAIIEKSTNKLINGCKTSIIPESVTEIEEYAFFSMSSLTKIDFPSTLAKINRCAFSGCNLSSIVIPNSVTTIGTNAFSSNSNLSVVDLTAFTDPETIPAAANDNILGNAVEKIYVADDDMLNKFKTATNWSRYADNYEVKPSTQL